MKFFTVKDQSNEKHKILLVPLSDKDMDELLGQCKTCMPSSSISSLVQNGHPYIIVDFGAGGWRTAIALDEKSDDGHQIGEELVIGDILTVILTTDSKAARVSKDKIYMNVPIDKVLAFSFLYTAEMAGNYAFVKMYKQPKAE